MSISLNDILPAPSNVSEDWVQKDWWFRQHEKALAVAIKEPPPYGHRKGWIPRNPEDFGDGGAFPEIQVAQFPLNMGKERKKQDGTNKTLAVQVDAEGKIRYDMIARLGHSKDKVVHSKLSDMKGGVIDEEDETLQKPDEEEIQNLTEKTKEALEKLTQAKVSAALPVKRAEAQGPAQYIRYTPSQQGSQFNAGATQKIIRMVEVQQDPMEPPRFRINQKIPRPPPSPPAPVMHSPTRKVTAKDQAEWKIPPCISNWKNPKGYTIPLDKRLAADGRGLQQTHINENFAKFAEALYIADRKARESVDMRANLEKKLAQKEKEEKEEKMRRLAQKAREERSGIIKNQTKQEAPEEVVERDEIRYERQQERRRERNIARMAPERRSKLQKDKERDISEKIALGVPDPKVRTNETQFDQRLFNQSKGLDSGLGADDETFAVYDKPWRTQETVAQSIYRPKKNLDQDVYGGDLDKIISTQRFVPDKGFAGADASSRREGPVQFEKQEEEDPFGLGKFLDEAKRGHKRTSDAADRDKDKDKESDRDSKRRR